MTKVLLLNPPSEAFLYKEDRCQNDANDLFSKIVRPPINLMSLAAISEKLGFQTKIIDAPIERINLNRLQEFIYSWNPKWIVANTSMETLDSDLITLQIAKEKGAKTITFGHAPSINDVEIMEKAKYIDFAIRGEPEKTFKELLEANIPLKDIKGLTYHEKSQIKRNKDRDFVENLDEIPFAAHHLIKHDRYRVPSSGEKFTTIQTSKGCPFQCTFCLSPLMNGIKVRKRSASSIIEEIKMVIKTLHIHNFLFRADTFTFDKHWVLQLCNEIIKNRLNITWFCNSRVDTIDQEMLGAMKRAGCQLICFGVESGKIETLKSIKKGITKEKIINTIHLTKKVGILAAATYIIGLPGDDVNSIYDTIQFSKEVDSDLVEFIPFCPTVGAEVLSQNLPQIKLIDIKKLSRYALIKYYFRPKMVVRMIRNFYMQLGVIKFLNLALVSVKSMGRILTK